MGPFSDQKVSLNQGVLLPSDVWVRARGIMKLSSSLHNKIIVTGSKVFSFLFMALFFVCHKYIFGWKITELTIHRQTKDFQTVILVQYQMANQWNANRILWSVLSRMKLMTGKETELLRELTAKWYFFFYFKIFTYWVYVFLRRKMIGSSGFWCLIFEITLTQWK